LGLRYGGTSRPPAIMSGEIDNDVNGLLHGYEACGGWRPPM
jgi:hypothetical protein